MKIHVLYIIIHVVVVGASLSDEPHNGDTMVLSMVPVSVYYLYEAI